MYITGRSGALCTVLFEKAREESLVIRIVPSQSAHLEATHVMILQTAKKKKKCNKQERDKKKLLKQNML